MFQNDSSSCPGGGFKPERALTTEYQSEPLGYVQDTDAFRRITAQTFYGGIQTVKLCRGDSASIIGNFINHGIITKIAAENNKPFLRFSLQPVDDTVFNEGLQNQFYSFEGGALI